MASSEPRELRELRESSFATGFADCGGGGGGVFFSAGFAACEMGGDGGVFFSEGRSDCEIEEALCFFSLGRSEWTELFKLLVLLLRRCARSEESS